MPYLGELSALLTALLWSFTSIFFSEASLRIGSLQVNITRLVFASLFLVITIPLMGVSLNVSGFQYSMLAISGLIGLIFGDSYLFKAFQHIGARLSMLIMASSPAMTAVLAYFFLGENLKIFGVLGIIITLSGIAVVVLERREQPSAEYKISKIGIFYGFLGALGQAVGVILAKLAFNEGDINGFVAAFIRIFSSVLVMLPAAVFLKMYDNPLKVFRKDTKALAYTTAGSITGPYLGITLSLIAVANTSTGIAATLMATVPIMMLPMVKFFYKEKLTFRSVAGAFLTVAGIVILFLV